MRIISCASYYGSGSSAITDLLSEYSSVQSFSNEEFRFVHDPNGISDLEYNLVDNFNRHNSGRALKLYKNLVDFYTGNFLNRRYENYFHGNWRKYSYKYINELTDFKYHGWWQYDLLDRGKIFYLFKRVPNRILKLTLWRNQPERSLNDMKREITYCSHPSEQKFLYLTRRYIYNLFNSVSDGKKNIMVDQILPPSNFSRYKRYFNNDLKLFIVDRDPRDIYVLEKKVWRDGVIPTDPITFCKWFKYTRYGRDKELSFKKQVKYIQFEDLIFKYNETVRKIEKWLNIPSSEHLYVKKYFNPAKSIKNVQTWKKYNISAEEIAYIERALRGYLYDDATTRDILE